MQEKEKLITFSNKIEIFKIEIKDTSKKELRGFLTLLEEGLAFSTVVKNPEVNTFPEI